MDTHDNEGALTIDLGDRLSKDYKRLTLVVSNFAPNTGHRAPYISYINKQGNRVERTFNPLHNGFNVSKSLKDMKSQFTIHFVARNIGMSLEIERAYLTKYPALPNTMLVPFFLLAILAIALTYLAFYFRREVSVDLTYAPLVYLALPLAIFFLTWLRLPVGLPATFILLYLCYCYCRDIKLKLDVVIDKYFIITMVVLLLFVYLSGVGGYGPIVSGDMHRRNAAFGDLLANSWPVYFSENGGSLVYYIGFWLVPAVISKLFSLSWTSANLVLFVWTLIGMVLAYLLVSSYLKVSAGKRLLLVAIIFITWAGLHTIGALIVALKSGTIMPFSTHYQGYLGIAGRIYGFRTIFHGIILFFHNAIPIWIMCGLFLQLYKRTDYYAFFGLIILPYSPWAFLSLGVVSVGLAIKFVLNWLKNRSFHSHIKTILSATNVLAVALIIIFMLYFTGTLSTRLYLFVPLKDWSFGRVLMLLLFYAVEFGIFMAVIYKENKNNLIYWLIGTLLIICPLVEINDVNLQIYLSFMPLSLLMMLYAEYLLSIISKPATYRHFIAIMLFVVCVYQFCGAMNTYYMPYGQSTGGKGELTLNINNIFADRYNHFNLEPQDFLFWKSIARTKPPIENMTSAIDHKTLLTRTDASSIYRSDDYGFRFYDGAGNLRFYNGEELISAPKEVAWAQSSEKDRMVLPPAEAFSIELLLLPKLEQQAYSTIFNLYDDSKHSISLTYNGSCYDLLYNNNPVSVSNICLKPDILNYVVFTSVGNVYINGSLQTSKDVPIMDKTYAIRLSSLEAGGREIGYIWQGRIQEVAFHNEILPASAIRETWKRVSQATNKH
ncbi:hypothetical protein AGMMS49941_02290 [Deferribacterales bacterium]|nr:hypothetical protein AGMMS49941_02290 [Deferribacterales bacterium]